MRKGLRHKPPVDFQLLRQVAGKHVLLFVLMSGFGLFSLAVSGLILWRGFVDARASLWIFGGLFFCLGLFLIGFACISCLSSVRYYYEKGLLKRHGLNLNATLVSKSRVATDITLDINRNARHEHIDELELSVGFEFQFAGQSWQCADLITSEKLFDALREGQTIPVRILPWIPERAAVRQRALLNQLKRENERAEDDNLRIAKPLIENDEI
ncbi:hypothetical protein [Phytobacter sp. V91]|uniref:hypothetical protein n=1 Tax=Phytobacter sp. V91 TaxID=3369425 RepID=UPI003F641572